MSSRKQIQVFSMSFLDVLSCALGGTLILLLLVQQQAAGEAEASASAKVQMQGRIDETTRALGEAIARAKAYGEAKREAEDAQDVMARAMDDAKREAEKALDDAIREAEAAQRVLIGFEGKMENVVFLFDTSGSMETDHFDDYKDQLYNWAANLATIEKFCIVEFDSDVAALASGTMLIKNAPNLQRAKVFIDAFQADGSTNTLGAFQVAFGMSGVDTMIIMTDGAPDQPVGEIHGFLNQVNSSRSVVINCVALGDYFNAEYGEFLQQVARDHGGTFVGR